MDQILYSSGLSFDSYGVEINKRKLIRNPYFIIVFLLSFLMLRLLSLFTDNKATLLMFGEVAYIVNMKTMSCVVAIILGSMAIMFQLIHYYNHKKGIKQTFIVVIKAASGLRPVTSIDLENKEEFRKLSIFSLRIFQMLKLQNNYIVPIAMGSCALFLYAIETNVNVIFTFGIIQSFSWSLFMHVCLNFLTYQILYIYILCNYFKLKVKNTNKTIVDLKNSCSKKLHLKSEFYSFNGLQNILHKYESICHEIDEYNTTYWSKFLMALWLCLGACIIFCLFMVIHRPMYLPLFMLTLYALILYTFTFLTVIMTVSSLNTQTNKSYKLLNFLYANVSKIKYRKIAISDLLIKIKVIFINAINYIN